MIVKKVFLSIIIFILTFVSTGCWNRRELNTLGIIGTMGIDLQHDEKIKVTVETVDTSKVGQGRFSDKGTTSGNYIQETGNSIFEAQRFITTKYDRKIFYPHMKCYIIGEALAKKGLTNYIDMLQRDHELRRTITIIIAKDTTAAEIMGIKGGIESTPGDYISKLLSLRESNGRVIAESVSDFLKAYYSKGTVPVIGVLSKTPKVQLTGVGKSESKFELSGEGAAVILDGKLKGYLDGTETQALSFITNKFKAGIETFGNSSGKGFTTYEIEKSKAKSTVELKGNQINIKVKLSCTGRLQEETDTYNLEDLNTIKKLEVAASKKIENDCKNTILRVQSDYKADIFGFGNIVHRKYPEEWKSMQNHWNDLFSQANVEIHVESKIITTGLVTDPINRIEGK